MGGYPPSEGRKGRWDGSGGYIERATCREVNKHGDGRETHAEYPLGRIRTTDEHDGHVATTRHDALAEDGSAAHMSYSSSRHPRAIRPTCQV